MLVIVVVMMAAAAAQGPPQPAPATAGGTAPTAEQVPASAGYTYQPEGRRDPFVSLIGRGDAKAGAANAGLPGLLVNEVTVKGVIRGRAGYIAMIQAGDSKTYIVRTGDRLADGTVKTITQDGVVFSQDVNDPLSLVKQRDVPKRIRASEGRG